MKRFRVYKDNHYRTHPWTVERIDHNSTTAIMSFRDQDEAFRSAERMARFATGFALAS